MSSETNRFTFSHLIKETRNKGYSQEITIGDYCKKYSLLKPKKKTADLISVDDYSKLDKSLKDNNCSVFRLGRANRSNNTKFSIVQYDDLDDHYILNESLKSIDEPTTYIPSVPARELFTYSLLPNATENGLVNLAIASGIIRDALALDKQPTLPAKGASTYDFTVYPHSNYPDLKFCHNSGQVEIDSVILGKKDGVECIFVIEAKMKKNRSSLSKSKIAYSIMAVKSKLNLNLPIVGVYLLMDRQQNGHAIFTVVPCEWNSPYIDQLVPCNSEERSYILPLSNEM